MSELLQKLDFIALLKQMSGSSLKWFNQLPKYKKLITCVAALTGSFASRYIYCKIHRKINNYPPGPLGVPIFGMATPKLPNLLSDYWDNLIKPYQEDNQGIVMFYIFGQPTVLINKMDTFQSIFKKEVYRYPSAKLKTGVRPFAGEDGHDGRWKHGRQLNQLSFTSLIKSSYLDQKFDTIMENEIFPHIDKCCNGDYYYCRSDIKWLGFAFLYGVLYGSELDQIPNRNNAEYLRFMYLDSKKFEGFFINQFVSKVFPKLDKKLAPNNELTDMVSKWEKETRKYRLKLSKNDTYFNSIEEHIENGEVSYDQVCTDVMSLVSAGLHVTLSAAEVAIYHCALFPDIQQRVYDELQSHYKKYGGFDTKKMNQLHIFRAFIYESLRYGAPVRLTLSRNVMKNGQKIGKYNVPKGATIYGTTYSLHRDPNNFEKPNEFYLDHFINDENNHFKLNKNFVVFGVGKRNCIGQSLAIKELFVILSHILNRYKFSIPKDIERDNWQIPKSFFKANVEKLPLIVERR